MRKEIQRLDMLRKECEKNIVAMSAACTCLGDKCPLGGLNISQQYLVVALEVLDNYRVSWGIPECVDMEFSVEIYPVEASKIIKVHQWCFISVFSSIESSLKKFLQSNRTILGAFEPKVHIHQIVQRSRKAGWITKEDEEVWLFINDMRNDLVHCNGESQKSREFTFPGGLEWKLVRGERPWVTFPHVPAVIQWMLGSFLKMSLAAVNSAKGL